MNDSRHVGSKIMHMPYALLVVGEVDDGDDILIELKYKFKRRNSKDESLFISKINPNTAERFPM